MPLPRAAATLLPTTRSGGGHDATAAPRVPQQLQPQDGAPGGSAPAGRHTVGGMAVAGLCLLATGLVVAYGVYLIVA